MINDQLEIHADAATDDTNLQTVYQFSDMGAGVTSIPNRYWIEDGISFNQYTNPDSHWSCGLYGSRHGVNDEQKNYQDPYQWNQECIDGRGLRLKTGRTMSLALSYLVYKKRISGYTRCVTLQDVKLAIFNGMNIFTGSNKIDFAQMRKNGDFIAVKSKGPGHFFEIDGYDDYSKQLRVRDSMGQQAWDDGHFYIKYEDFDCLYTCMALVPGANIMQAKIEADKRTIQKAISLGITNGERLNDGLLRYEAALLVTRIKLGALDENTLLEQAKLEGIWDGTRSHMYVTRGELMLMVAALLGIREGMNDNQSILNLIKTGITLGQNRESKATREEGILLVTRAYDYLHKSEG